MALLKGGLNGMLRVGRLKKKNMFSEAVKGRSGQGLGHEGLCKPH